MKKRAARLDVSLCMQALVEQMHTEDALAMDAHAPGAEYGPVSGDAIALWRYMKQGEARS